MRVIAHPAGENGKGFFTLPQKIFNSKMNRASTLFLALTVGLLGLFFIGFCKKKAQNTTFDRPNDPFVFRSVLDKKPRMVTLALSDDLWASYSTDSCSLYKVWKGGVDFDGAVYTMQHGPQPMSIGKAWTANDFRQPWRVEIAGRAAENPRADWRGHRILADGRAELFYDLVLSTGEKIRINERPEFVSKNGQVGFERAFSVENAPENAKISLEMNAQSLADASAIQVSGGSFLKKSEATMPTEEKDLRAVAVAGTIELAKKGQTTVTTFFINHPLVTNPNDAEKLAETSRLTPAERLINRSDCRTCHNPTEKTVGPAYAEIAKKYLNTPENVALLTQKVKLGGAGVWGAAAMSAHPDMAEGDIKNIVIWIIEFFKTDHEGEGKKDV